MILLFAEIHGRPASSVPVDIIAVRAALIAFFRLVAGRREIDVFADFDVSPFIAAAKARLPAGQPSWTVNVLRWSDIDLSRYAQVVIIGGTSRVSDLFKALARDEGKTILPLAVTGGGAVNLWIDRRSSPHFRILGRGNFPAAFSKVLGINPVVHDPLGAPDVPEGPGFR